MNATETDSALSDEIAARLRRLVAEATRITCADLYDRVARLEGQVELLVTLIQPAQPQMAAGATPTEPALPEQVEAAVRHTATGNRALDRHLRTVATRMLQADLSPDLVAKRIRDGETVE